MGSPAIFSGKRTKLLTTKGVLNSDTSINDNDGVLNYIKNGHAEVNALGWATYKDAAGVLPVDGTGGTPTHITFTQTSTAPLGGLGSFLVTNSGSTSAQGEGTSYNFTIDAKDKAKVLQISFDYLVNSGTFVAGSSTVHSDLEVYIYDVTNALIIQPSSYKLLSNNTTLTDKFSATFQTASNSTSYRLILHCPTTATAAWSIKLDNVCVCPSQYVYGSPVTDWQSYTPTFTNINGGTTATSKSQWRRVGDSMEITGILVAGGTGIAISGVVIVSIPSGFTIDSTKLLINGDASIGNGNLLANSLNRWPLGVVAATSTSFNLVSNGSSTGAGGNFLTTTIPIASSTYWIAGSSISWNIKVPILGWSSSVQMSDSADTRVVAARFTIPASSSVTAGNPINFLTSSIDTHSAVTVGAAWKFIAPVSGLYMVSANLNTVLANTIRVYKGGTSYQYIASNAVSVTASGSCLVSMNTGEYIDIRPDVTSTTQVVCSVDIQRLTGPSAISATETVACRYTNTAGTSIAAGGTTPVPFVTKDYDTTGSWNGTTFTAPISGKYEVKCGIFYATGSFTGTSKNINIRKNTTLVSYISIITPPSTATYNLGMNGSDTINLLAGETLDFGLAHNEGTARSLDTLSGANHISITRVGN